METAGKQLEDEDAREAIKESGRSLRRPTGLS
jgi:hypothetical protein